MVLYVRQRGAYFARTLTLSDITFPRIMPAAMVSHPSALCSSLPDFVSQVPRPWDFPSVPPKNRTNENNTGENQKASPTEARPVNPPPSLPKPAGQPYSVLSAVATPSGLKASPPVSPK